MKLFIFVLTVLITRNVIAQNNDPGGYSYNIENNVSPQSISLGRILNSNSQNQQQQQQQQININQGYIPPQSQISSIPSHSQQQQQSSINQGYIPPQQQQQQQSGLLQYASNFPLSNKIQQQQQHNNVGISNITPPQLPSITNNEYIPPTLSVSNQGLFQQFQQPTLNNNYNGQQNNRVTLNSILPPIPPINSGTIQQQHQQQLSLPQLPLQQSSIYQNNISIPPQQQQQQQSYQFNHNINGYTSGNIHNIPTGNNVQSQFVTGFGSQQNEKQIYVHLPPAPLQEYPRYPLPPQYPPRKHYKIILVKSPSPPTPPPVIVPPPVEEKTLVYVLVKKPDPPSQEELQAIQQQQTFKSSKPEVYFIKYKTNKEKGANIKVEPSNETGDNESTGTNGIDTNGVTGPDIDIRSSSSSSSSLKNSIDDNKGARIFPNGITVPQNLIDSTATKPKSSAIYEAPFKTYKS